MWWSTERYTPRKADFSQKSLEKFPADPVVKNPSTNAGAMGLIPVWGGFHMPQGNEAHVPNDWACSLEPPSCNYRAHVLQVLKPVSSRTVLRITEATTMRRLQATARE